MCKEKNCTSCQVSTSIAALCNLNKGDVLEMICRQGRIENMSGTLIIVPKKIHGKKSIPFKFRNKHFIAYKKPRTDILLVSVV